MKKRCRSQRFGKFGLAFGRSRRFGKNADYSALPMPKPKFRHITSSVKSNVATMNIGVPQGSVLGPILFLLYINDLPNVSQMFSSTLYADDTTLFASNHDYDMLVNDVSSELEKFSVWCASNRLSLNIGKTHPMLLSNRKSLNSEFSDIMFNGSLLKYEKSVKFLGMYLDDNYKFDVHIDYIARKVSQTVGIFYRIQPYVSESLLKNLYYGLVYPYLIYCNIIWGGTNITHLRRLIVLQKKIIRIITASDYLAHTAPLFKKLKILTIPDLHRYLLVGYVHRNIDKFKSHSDVHDYFTRYRQNICVNYCRLSSTQRSLQFSASRAWNSLPNVIREIGSLSKFNHAVKDYFISFY